jgi:hypothetical protein
MMGKTFGLLVLASAIVVTVVTKTLLLLHAPISLVVLGWIVATVVSTAFLAYKRFGRGTETGLVSPSRLPRL